MNVSDRKAKTGVGEGGTRHKLLDAAALEFNESGFHGTDTNRIARRAGFAPQTFYRHFSDKTDVFIEVYRRWQQDERREILRIHQVRTASQRRSLTIAATLLQSHRRWRVFRRSLRLLAVEESRVRRARADSRRQQLAALGHVDGHPAVWAARVAALLGVERLCDGAADEETADLGIPEELWQAQVADAIDRLRHALGAMRDVAQ